ncbi:hypothetical protein [Rikenella microfusus]|uniref:Uncharacterized protein n=1 Tax=Rikenella microfusus TaxID=28139 RepID=A0A379MQ88_9BACT|nr:hypothetical protein [Rikenella microfusus]SUE33683.1 Uncharacterised protein [Rikenella microfusus]
MKRQTQTVGVRSWAGDDLLELQSEPLKALDAFFAEYGPCIIQGCEAVQTEDGAGTYDVAAGLVALEADDPDGVRRVMAMPFAGAKGVALPLYLTANVETVSEPYGDGKVKPIAYVYTGKASGVQPDGDTPYLTLTAGGGRFVDAVQDTAHRFITDAERSKWNRILEQAKEYADGVAATGSEAALRSAKEYADTQDTALKTELVQADADTLISAKEYADKIVAALAGTAPETLDTLQELAAALGNDPNFSATVMQMIGERVTAEAMNTALASRMPIEEGWAGNADDIENLVSKPFGAKNIPFAYYPFLSFGGGGYKAQFNALNNSLRFRSTNESGAIQEWVEIWHAGNFNPASKANAPATLQNADLNTLTSNGLYVADGAISNAPASTANCRVLVIATSPYRVTQIAQVYDADRLFFRRRVDEQWQPWRELWHAGNFDAQNSLKYLGRGTLLGQFGNGAAGHGFTDHDTPIGQSSSFLRFGMSGYEVEICLGGYSSWNNGWTRIYFRCKDGDSGSVSDWREFYHTGNLSPATAAAAGLMSAADKTKLDGIADGGMKLLGAGVVNGTSGELNKKKGAVTMASRVSGAGNYRVMHNIGHTNYEVHATCMAIGGTGGHATIVSKSTNYFDVWTADDETRNDLSFFFQIYEF